MTPDGQAVAKVRYSHEALCDMLLAQPWSSQKDIAAYFDYSEAWVSQLLQSDALKEYMIKRKVELMDPLLRASMEERLDGLARRSIDILQAKLDLPIDKVSSEVAIKALDISTRARGYGAGAKGVSITQNFVVAMPEKSVNGEAWVEKHRPPAITVDTVISDA